MNGRRKSGTYPFEEPEAGRRIRVDSKPLSKTKTRNSIHVVFRVPRSDRFLDLLSVSIAGDGGVMIVPLVRPRTVWECGTQIRTLSTPKGRYFKPTNRRFRTNAALKLHYHRSGVIEIKPQITCESGDHLPSSRVYGEAVGAGSTRQIFSLSVADASLYSSKAREELKGYAVEWWIDGSRMPKALNVAGVLYEGQDAARVRESLKSDGSLAYVLDSRGEMIRMVDLKIFGVDAVLGLHLLSDQHRIDWKVARCSFAGLSSVGKESVKELVCATVGPGFLGVRVLSVEQLHAPFASGELNQAYEVMRDRFGIELGRAPVDYEPYDYLSG